MPKLLSFAYFVVGLTAEFRFIGVEEKNHKSSYLNLKLMSSRDSILNLRVPSSQGV